MNRDFLVETPVFVEVKQRITYESMALVVQIMELNFTRILELISTVVERSSAENPNFSPDDRASLLGFAWSIVDQADLLRQLIHSQGKEIAIDESKEFLRISVDTQKLRNWMDHLPARIHQYVKSSGGMPPAHGAFSFTVVDEKTCGATRGELVEITRVPVFRTVVVLSTAMHRNLKVEGEPVPYSYFTVPYDHFFLQAFGTNLDVKLVVNKARAFRDAMNLGVMNFCLQKADEISMQPESIQSEKTREEILRPSEQLAGTLVMVATRNAP